MMDQKIIFYVEKLQEEVMYAVASGADSNLYDFACEMLVSESADNKNAICQAYEVVKHALIG
ncbi:hypothetical protein ACFVP8_21800 [Viridibacillus arvi]|uniref:hypothetical protein n=2 Tax=Viridibacillus arvi TaxID=263475 RepID=UPI0036D08EF5